MRKENIKMLNVITIVFRIDFILRHIIISVLITMYERKVLLTMFTPLIGI